MIPFIQIISMSLFLLQWRAARVFLGQSFCWNYLWRNDCLTSRTKSKLTDTCCKAYFKSHGQVILLFSQSTGSNVKMFAVEILWSSSPWNTEQFMKGGVVLPKAQNQGIYKSCRKKENMTMGIFFKKCIFFCPLSQYLFQQWFRI